MIEIRPLPLPGSPEYAEALQRLPPPELVREQAETLLERVRQGGDEAVRELTLRFDRARVERSRVGEQEIERALASVPGDLLASLRVAAANISRVHLAQRFHEERVMVVPGVEVWREWRPLGRVGLYVPGGRASYPSSVLMLGVPARLAGCREIVLCTPPGPDGVVDPTVLAAAALAGATEVHAVGGVQAIAALAYGTESIPAVEKIFGPGNAHVTAAKRLVFGEVAVDMPAGPSEVVVISDGSVAAERLAADLRAQTEHAGDALGILIATDRESAAAVTRLVDPALCPQVRAFASPGLEEAVRFANDFAPEHLILAVDGAEGWLDRIESAGSVFLGASAPAAVGDYVSGANHVIPTGGLARSFSALGLEAFGHTLQVQRLSPAGLERLAPAARELAAAEGFGRHWESIRVRLGGGDASPKVVPEPRESCLALHPYQWEASTLEVARRAGLAPEEVVRFDTNTCPWELVEGGGGLSEYPDPNYAELTRAIARYAGVGLEMITVGAGADELLSLIARSYVGWGDPVVVPHPSYSMFRTVAEAEGGSVVEIPEGEPEELVEASSRARLTFLCNPNNPTGAMLPEGLVREVALASAGIVVVDEAYFEFSGSSSVPLVGQLPNLVVVRTLSKAFGLAGARVGYAISSPQVQSALARLRPPASVSAISASLGARALEAAGLMRVRVAELAGWRADLAREAARLGFRVRDTAANFLLLSSPDGLPEALERRGLVVRSLPPETGLGGWIRVTVRRPEENQRLLLGLDRWVAAGAG